MITNADNVTVLTLANAGLLAARLIEAVSGNDLSNSLQGETVTSEQFQLMAQQRIVAQVTGKTKC